MATPFQTVVRWESHRAIIGSPPPRKPALKLCLVNGGHHPSRPGHRPPGLGPSVLRRHRRPLALWADLDAMAAEIGARWPADQTAVEVVRYERRDL